ncbi:MAG: hypothetical protein RIS22_121 [Actinomycetota bacterium]|jgi:hypothetical protein
MEVGFVIFGLFTLLVLYAIFRYEQPNKSRGKLTGRGGDFQDE